MGEVLGTKDMGYVMKKLGITRYIERNEDLSRKFDKQKIFRLNI